MTTLPQRIMTTTFACAETEPVTFGFAKNALLRRIEPLNSQPVPLSDACERITAEDIIAQEDLVPYARSAMDGYALRSIDTVGASVDSPLRLPIIGKVFTGDRQSILAAGAVIGITTGAAIPINADAVVPHEQVTVRDQWIILNRSVAAGDCIFPPAEDVRKGEVLLKRGSVLDPGSLGLLAFAGKSQIRVYRRPRVSLLCTGSELVEVNETPGCGQVRNSNASVLTGVLSQCGAETRYCGAISDTSTQLRSALESAARNTDLLITTGGASVGERDLVKSVLEEIGTEFEFRRVAMRPGKPFAFGWLRGLPICVLPGNPAAAFVCYQQLVRPLLLKLAGRNEIDLPTLPATLVGNAKSKVGSQYFVFANVKVSRFGFLVEPLNNQCSALVRNPAKANALITLPEGPALYKRGDEVMVQILNWSSILHENSTSM